MGLRNGKQMHLPFLKLFTRGLSIIDNRQSTFALFVALWFNIPHTKGKVL